jgi:hypothetical protein
MSNDLLPNGTVIASEAKQSRLKRGFWIAWSLALLAVLRECAPYLVIAA